MSIFDNYDQLYQEFMSNDCEAEILERNGLRYHYIISIRGNGKIKNIYQKEREEGRERLRMAHFYHDIQNQLPFVVFVVLLKPGAIFYHQFAILYRPGLLEVVDSQPPISGSASFNDRGILHQYASINNFVTKLGERHDLMVMTNDQIYDQHYNGYPPQYLENETLEHFGRSDLLKGWQGRSCILWSTMIALESYLQNIYVKQWMHDFLDKFHNDTTSLDMINWMRGKVFYYLVECKKNIMDR